jgi:hypothetical protein
VADGAGDGEDVWANALAAKPEERKAVSKKEIVRTRFIFISLRFSQRLGSKVCGYAV